MGTDSARKKTNAARHAPWAIWNTLFVFKMLTPFFSYSTYWAGLYIKKLAGNANSQLRHMIG